MSEWKTVTLREVVAYIAKGIPPSYVENESKTTIRVLNQKCNRDYKISYSESRLHDLAKKTVPDEKYLRDDDILINSTGTGTAGRVAQILKVPCPTVVDGHMIVIRPNDKMLPRYLGYAIKAHQHEILKLDEGSTGQTELNRERLLSEIIISYPESLSKQKIIADTLSALDDKIENNNKINHNLEQMAQAIFKSWFVDFEPFGGVMPSDWRKTDIYSIADIIYGAPFASKLFNTEKKGTPIIRIRDLKEQHFVTYTTEIHPKGYLIQAGDIIVGMDGEFRPYFWGNDSAWLNQRVCIFANKRTKGKAFLYYLIKPLLFAIEQTQVATTVIHIGKKDFDSFTLFLPDDNTLNKFDNATDSIIWQIVHNNLENKKLVELRDSLLPRLMSGELSVSDITT